MSDNEKLVNMKLQKTKAEEMYPSMEPPAYPWGLCINLEEEQIKKLGLTLPAVGATVTIEAKAEVTNRGESQTQDGTRRSLSLQITDLAIGS